MLAVRNSNMGSSKPPHFEMPFGYSFDTPQNFPQPPPTAPAPGLSLLDDSESKFLESFFDGVSNEQFNFNDMFANGPDGSELGLGWDELPPAFMGTSSSFGQQPPPNMGLPPQHFGQMHPRMNAGVVMPPSASADVLEAATLLQNGSVGRSHSMVDSMLFGSQDMSLQHTNGHADARSQSVSQYPPTRQQHHGLPQRALGESFYRDPYYHDMVFGADPEEAARRRHAVQKNVDIQWGSDTRFASPQGFTTDQQEKMAASERSRLQMIDSVFQLDVSNANSSAENTQPSSPVHTRTKSNTQNTEDDESRPRKRRKSKYPEDDDDEDNVNAAASTSKLNGKKRKPVKKSGDSPAAEITEQVQKRRKSGAASAAVVKATRENLTEDQKRENHIKSEQKRRSLIKEGFDDLNELVPGLRGGGFSKSAVLIMAADWLEQILRGNEELRARLQEMEGS